MRSLLIAWLGLLASCSTLPDYARPSAQVMNPADYSASDVILYRELSREDFRGASPPERVISHASKLSAYTCATIVPESSGIQFAIVPDRLSSGYIAQLPRMEYRAEMDRECSWWNPKGSPARADYTLQHEQIHFAIVELQARRLEQEVVRLRGRGSSPQAAAADLQRSIDSAIQEAMNRVLRRSTSFDEDTSLGYRPVSQDRWAEQIRVELEESH